MKNGPAGPFLLPLPQGGAMTDYCWAARLAAAAL